MRNFYCLIIIFASVLLPSGSLYAGESLIPHEVQALSFMDKCNKIEKLGQKTANSLDIAEINYCTGYLLGVLETISTMKSLDQKNLESLPCLQENVSIEQYIKVLQKAAADTPEMLNSPKNLFIFPVLSAVYPCKK